MPPRKKVAPPPPVDVAGELKEILEILEEQKTAMAKKALESKDRMNAFWFGKGDHIGLLISRAPGAPGPAHTIYICNIVDVRITP